MNTVTRDQLWSFIPRNGAEVAELTSLFFQPGTLADKAFVRPATQAISEAFRPVFPDEVDPYAIEAIQANNARHPNYFDPSHVPTGAERRGWAATGVVSLATARVGLPRATAFTPRAPVLIEAAENVGASSAADGSRLTSQLIAEEVANGHALAKHVANGEFAPLGIRTKGQFQNFVEDIVSNPATLKRYATDGTTYYLDDATRTIVIRGQRGEATAFRPDYGVGWENYLNSQVPRNARVPGYDPVPGGRY